MIPFGRVAAGSKIVSQIRQLEPSAGNRRTGRFLARLDAHLRSIPDLTARREFLDRQIKGWEQRYARFIATEAASEPVVDAADPPQPADFLLTITGLAARRNAHRNNQKEIRMPQG